MSADILIMAAVGYLIGALPFGVLIGKAVAKVDVREYGSGSMGMTNVLRTVGKPAAAAVLLLDIGKGVAAVIIAKSLFDNSPGAEVAAALAALIGHNWPVFIGFRGGAARRPAGARCGSYPPSPAPSPPSSAWRSSPSPATSRSDPSLPPRSARSSSSAWR